MKACKVISAPKDELTHHEKLVRSGAIDLRNNHTIEKNGKYIIVKPINPLNKFQNRLIAAKGK